MEKKITYDVKVETMIPATLHFRVTAESPEKAIELTKRSIPREVKTHLGHRKDIKAVVYKAYSLIIELTKGLR